MTAAPGPSFPGSPAATGAALAEQGYLVEEGLATAIFLAVRLGQPLLLEGAPGVGKTAAAEALAALAGAELIRLQCHEGIDAHSALYDWDYARQMLAIRAAEAGAEQADLFGQEFLVRRPLLAAIEHDGPTVLLIDEVDRADEEFEALLLEILSEFQVTIPELGTVRATRRPLVVLTSNRTRELHDALKRRCVYHWIDYPPPELERRIVRERLPGLPEAVAARVVEAAGRLRDGSLYKAPGIGETIAWSEAMAALGPERPLGDALGTALKVKEDIDLVRRQGLLDGV
ncbi:MAG TPA: MoxR family ATPase [Solirubrobacterales bacterium]